MIPLRYAPLADFCRSRYESGDTSHDFQHVLRVLGACLAIGAELRARMEVLIPAALLHDIVQIPKNHPDRARASAMAAEEAAQILARFDLESLSAEIGRAILEHGFSARLSPSSLESAILQDADRLDAIGALGISRVFSCGAKMGAMLYHPEDPLCETRATEALDDKRHSVDHFFVKLLKLPQMMNTEPGKRLAFARQEFMLSFLKQLKAELSLVQGA